MEAVLFFAGIYMIVGVFAVIAGLAWHDFVVRCFGLAVFYVGVFAVGITVMCTVDIDSGATAFVIIVLLALLLVCVSGSEKRPWRKYQPSDEDETVLEPIFGRPAESPVGQFDKH